MDRVAGRAKMVEQARGDARPRGPGFGVTFAQYQDVHSHPRALHRVRLAARSARRAHFRRRARQVPEGGATSVPEWVRILGKALALQVATAEMPRIGGIKFA